MINCHKCVIQRSLKELSVTDIHRWLLGMTRTRVGGDVFLRGSPRIDFYQPTLTLSCCVHPDFNPFKREREKRKLSKPRLMVAEISARLGPSRGSLIVRTRMFPRVPSSLCHGDNSRLRARGETQGKLLFPVFTWQWEALMFFFYRPFTDSCPFKPNCSRRKELWV